MHLLPFVLVVLLFTGCQFAAIPTPTSSPPPHFISIPEPGASVEAELGETVCAKGVINTRKGLKLKNPISASFALSKMNCGPGFYKECLEDSKWTYYIQIANATIGIPKANNQDLRIVNFTPGATYHLLPHPPAEFEFSEEDTMDSESFKQELIYNGKSGNVLKFLYRELSGNTLRYPFSQDVQYDLADGKIIGFKGARLEVIEASNTKLKYKLITNFPTK